MRVLVAIPVLNEAAQLTASVEVLCAYLRDHCPFATEVVVVDNGSTDGSLGIAESLRVKWPDLRVCHLDLRGRGRALKTVWSESSAEILSYMDADLSTNLASFEALISALQNGNFDVAVGSRLLPESLTQRSWWRERLSRGYNWLVRAVFGTRLSDMQCGFKAITAEAARRLLPFVEDTGWFFDTELLVIAEKCGYRICEVPVRWTERRDSRVKILATVWNDLKGVARLKRRLASGGLAHLTREPEGAAKVVRSGGAGA